MAVATPTKAFGAAIKRREDPRFITGKGQYTDDVRLLNMATMAILRSPYGHARITRIDVESARRAPGVLAVYTGKDIQSVAPSMPCAWLIPNSDLKTPNYPPLAVDRVRYFGEGVAMVVAENGYQAKDALDLIEVDYEPLPAVVDQEQAVQEGAPQLHDDVPHNLAFTWHIAGGDADAAIRDADVVIRQRFINQRLLPTAIETRGAVADFNQATGDLTIWLTSQNPHIHRLLISLVLGIPEHKIRVIARDVGGGFGSKIPLYAGEVLAIIASRDLGRPVRWSEERSENYVATTHGRDHIQDVELAANRDGRITGLRVKAWASLGAYLSTAAPGVPTWLFGLILSGCYDIPNADCTVYGVFTNKTPTDAYRGAGRPEATYLIERMVDLLAAELKLDPAEVRRKNFIPADKFPYTVANGGLTYDSGNYQGTLDKALELVDYQALRREQEEARRQGRMMGIGFSTYVEVCGLAPSAAAGAMGFQGGLWESATVRVHPTGKVVVLTGTSPHGQGEETAFAQIVADELGVDVNDVEVVHGDTAQIQYGMGTYGSRTAVVGGAAIAVACQKVREKALKIAAHMMEVAPEDVEWADGRFRVKGAPETSKTIADVALHSYLAWSMPQGVTPGLEEGHFYDPSNNVFPFGCHICVVEIDRDTGDVAIKRYVAVDDCGPVINPMLVDGQLHGGIAQGIAQALFEEAVYDENGQLLTGTMMDYAVPKAADLPKFELARTVTPSPHNPLGIKGIGEAGTIAASPAVVNAVVDALSPLGIKHIDMPLKPEKVWRAIEQASR
ncbi:MAG: molybdopterin-dependent oxidoreductase [Chloroflexi bacterium]|nr:molybdopterin-dependent oxidoreductase [Chloroflexota bacterium]